MTDACIRGRVVDSLLAVERSGLKWALLSEEERLAEGIVDSDIDMVVDIDVQTAARRIVVNLPDDLLPIMWCSYDVNSLALFLAPPQGGSRIQLDLLHDPVGHGRLGLLSDQVLQSAVRGRRWPRANEVDSYLYQVRKRIWKRDPRRLSALLSDSPATVKELDLRVRTLFRRGARQTVASVLAKGIADRFPRRRACSLRSFWPRVRRVTHRLARPVGSWVHIETSNALERELLEAVRRLVPYFKVLRMPTSRPLCPWWLLNIAPIRWRPGLAISVGKRRGLNPDIIIPAKADGSAEGTVELVLRTLSHRTRLRFLDRSH